MNGQPAGRPAPPVWHELGHLYGGSSICCSEIPRSKVSISSTARPAKARHAEARAAARLPGFFAPVPQPDGGAVATNFTPSFRRTIRASEIPRSRTRRSSHTRSTRRPRSPRSSCRRSASRSSACTSRTTAAPSDSAFSTSHPDWLEWLIIQNTNAFEIGFTAAWEGLRGAYWKELERCEREGGRSLPGAGHDQGDLPARPSGSEEDQSGQLEHGQPFSRAAERQAGAARLLLRLPHQRRRSIRSGRPS